KRRQVARTLKISLCTIFNMTLKTVAATTALLAATHAAAAPNGYTLYWSDEFNLGVGKQALGAQWGYDLGNSGWGNNELE
ncbi:hypothetical protein ABTF84_20115, partial [Acinetobacter baumannii]